MKNQVLNEAIQDYIGFMDALSPKNNARLVEEKFGVDIKNTVEKIILELNEVPIDWKSLDLSTASKYAVESICRKYTFLDEKSEAAMKWKFSFDWR